MKFNYVSRKCTARDDTKAYTEKKLKKLERFFTGDCVLHVIYTLEKPNVYKVEVTADYNGLIFRAQASSDDFKPCVDEIVDILTRQIRKHKTKLEKRMKDSSFSFEGYQDNPENEQDEEFKIIKSKNITVKPMTVDEAILQMNMLGHDFFVFREDSSLVKVVYRRKDGNYGLIETD